MPVRHFFLYAVFLFAAASWAESIPTLTGPLMDDARLLDSSEAADVRQAIEALNASGKTQLVVYTVPSLEGSDIETFSMKVAEKWKLGKKGVDNGLLLVIAPNDRRMRFEVGYGLEGDIPDVIAKRILSDEMAPYFRQRQFGDGIRTAIASVGQRLGVNSTAPAPRLIRKKTEPKISFFLFLLLFVGMILFNILRGGGGGGFGGGPRYRGGGWGGGGGSWGGGGGFGGGGGGFGGGGSSSSW